MNQENKFNISSRRTMLRNSAIAATGTVILPSFLTGCTKEMQDMIKDRFPKKGPAPIVLTASELEAAADNLNRMRKMLAALYQEAFDYDEVVFLALGSTVKDESSWTNFIVNIIIDIAAAAAAATAVVLEGPLAVPAIACMSAFLHDWGIGKDTPLNLAPLSGFFAGYQNGQLAMKDALDRQLGVLTDVTDNYANLRAAWKDPIEFNGGTYTLADLAKSFFPDSENHSVEYRKIYDPMYRHHQKSVWNLAIMKCCTLWPRSEHNVYVGNGADYVSFPQYGRVNHYPSYKGTYLRGVQIGESDGQRTIVAYVWNLGIGGNEFPEAASNILFYDDTPSHMINPDGLFLRSYVFEQFHTKKPDFQGAHALATDITADFATLNDDWNFTGGLFPQLITK